MVYGFVGLFGVSCFPDGKLQQFYEKYPEKYFLLIIGIGGEVLMIVGPIFYMIFITGIGQLFGFTVDEIYDFILGLLPQ